MKLKMMVSAIVLVGRIPVTSLGQEQEEAFLRQGQTWMRWSMLFSPQGHLCWWLLSAAGLIPCQMMKDPWPSHPCLTEPFQVPSLPCSSLPLCLCPRPILFLPTAALLPVPAPSSPQDTARVWTPPASLPVTLSLSSSHPASLLG